MVHIGNDFFYQIQSNSFAFESDCFIYFMGIADHLVSNHFQLIWRLPLPQSTSKLTSEPKKAFLLNNRTYLVIRRRSRKLGEPRRRGIDGDLDERLKNEKELGHVFTCIFIWLTLISHLCYCCCSYYHVVIVSVMILVLRVFDHVRLPLMAAVVVAAVDDVEFGIMRMMVANIHCSADPLILVDLSHADARRYHASCQWICSHCFLLPCLSSASPVLMSNNQHCDLDQLCFHFSLRSQSDPWSIEFSALLLLQYLTMLSTNAARAVRLRLFQTLAILHICDRTYRRFHFPCRFRSLAMNAA